MLTERGQALVELVIGFAILSIVLVSITFLIIGAREGRERAANILEANTSTVFQSEAMRSVREAGWNNMKNGIYHLVTGSEYKVTICKQGGCPPMLDESIGSSNANGEVSVDFDFPPQLPPGLYVKASKISGCSPECAEDHTIKSLTLKNLTPNRGIRVLICNPGGCGLIQEVTGTSNSAGELTTAFSYSERSAVEIFAFRVSTPSNPCSGFGCLEFPSIKNMTAGDFTLGTGWFLAQGSEDVGDFTRQIVIEDVCRNGSELITDCPGGSVDPSTKKVTSQVSWSSFFGGSVENVFYLTRNVGNDRWLTTTQSQFNAGSYTLTQSTPTGDVILEPAGSSVISSFDNPSNSNALGVFTLNNYTYLTSSNAGGPDFTIINTSNPSSLPSTPTGSLDLGTNINSVQVEDSPTSGRFAYLASDNDSKELTVLSISNKSAPTEVASLDLIGNQNANDIFLSGSGNQKFAYIGRQSGGGSNREFYIISVNTCFDVSGDGLIDLFNDIIPIAQNLGRTGPSVYDLNGNNIVNNEDITLAQSRFGFTCPHAPNPSIVGELEVGSTGSDSVNGVFISGNNAFLASSKDNQELLVANISNKTAPTIIGSFDASGSFDANEVVAVGSTAYLTTNSRAGASNPEFFVLNVSNPTSGISVLGSYNIDSNINSVRVGNNKAYLATSLSNKEFLILNIQNLSSITESSFTNLNGGANELVINNNFGYLATTNNSRELQIVAFGTGQSYALSGIYESPTFDCLNPIPPATKICKGGKAGYNYITWQATDPDNTGNTFKIEFQIQTSNSNGPWTFTGPVYNSPSPIPFDSAENRFFKFKVIFTGNGTDTPRLHDVSVNYSP